MRRMMRLAAAAALVVLAMLLSTGCSFRMVASPDELYTLPNLPAEYTALNNSIQLLLSYGMEYAAPVSGSHTQNVQLMDLNGDGEQEAIVFLRNSTEEQPLRIHIFTPVGDGYQQTAVISGSGSNIHSFNARDLDGDEWLELLVGWETGAELRALTVYSLRGSEPQELVRTGYAKYAVEDMDWDDDRELVVFGTDEQGRGIADLYMWKDGLEKVSSVSLSVTVEELSAGGIVSGVLRDGSMALFASGVNSENVAITDILCAKKEKLVNVTLSEFTGMTTEIFRHRGLSPEDINGDGVTEIPAAVAISGDEEGEGEYYRIDWYNYGSAGLRNPVISTYHNTTDGWYLELPTAWTGWISVTRGFISSDEIAVTFYRRGEDSGPVLRICAITGSSREQKAARGNRIILSRQADVIYTAELLAANAGWDGTVTEDELRSSFHLIERKWAAGDN